MDGGSGKSKAAEKANPGATGAQRSIEKLGKRKATVIKELIHRELPRDILSPRVLRSQKKCLPCKRSKKKKKRTQKRQNQNRIQTGNRSWNASEMGAQLEKIE